MNIKNWLLLKMFLLNKYNKEIEIITEYKRTLQRYNELDKEEYCSDSDTRSMLSLREQLNNHAGKVRNYVEKANISSGFFIGETYTGVFSNLFHLSYNQRKSVIDILDQAIGNYKYFQEIFKRKLFNPLCWIGELIRIPFHLISFAGFDVTKIELFLISKIYKLVFSFILSFAFLLAAIVTILHYCNIPLSDLLSLFGFSNK